MGEQETKGFRVIDKRGMSDEEKGAGTAPVAEAVAPPPQGPRPEKAEGERPREREPRREEVPGERPSAVAEPSGVGGPTFLDLVGTLQFGAMANLGMIQTPDGKRPPVNLPAAKDSIDLLGILQEKTKGNLTEEESSILSEGLYHIRMAYVAAVKASAPGPGGKKS
jgi:hypothetical protein